MFYRVCWEQHIADITAQQYQKVFRSRTCQPHILGPKQPKHGIPSSEWPNVLRRIIENEEPLRTVAENYGVSHETIRRIVRAVRKLQAD